MRAIGQAIRTGALALLWLYKRAVSPLLPPTCRFYPTCSDYAAEVFRAHSPGRAFWLSLRRLARCGPWHPGGFDPPPAPPTTQTARQPRVETHARENALG